MNTRAYELVLLPTIWTIIWVKLLSLTNSHNLVWQGVYSRHASFSVVHGPTKPPWLPIPFGLPQDFVFSILLYIIHAADLGTRLAANAVLSQSYADDVQPYLHCMNEWILRNCCINILLCSLVLHYYLFLWFRTLWWKDNWTGTIVHIFWESRLEGQFQLQYCCCDNQDDLLGGRVWWYHVLLLFLFV